MNHSQPATRFDLESALDRWALRMNVRIGIMLVAGIGIFAITLKLA